MEQDEIFNAAFYRRRADEARESAAKASTPEHREGYLELAAAWKRLAEEAEAERRTHNQQ
jgi:hypothetical protein